MEPAFLFKGFACRSNPRVLNPKVQQKNKGEV